MKKQFLLGVITHASSFLVLFLLTFSTFVWAHGGEDHSSEQVVSSQPTQDNFSLSGFGEVYEMTVAYKAFEVGDTVALRLFVANLETNKPVSDAELSLTLTGPDVDLGFIPTPVESSPGEYAIEVSIPQDADYSFLVEITTSEEFDLFSIDGFSPPPLAAFDEDETQGFSLMNYSLFLMLGGYIVVAMGAYFLGTRERIFRKSTSNDTQVEG